jgi:hypothetical protein
LKTEEQIIIAEGQGADCESIPLVEGGKQIMNESMEEISPEKLEALL